MKTAEYVKQFKLDTPNYNFNREKFMEAFGQEFKDRIEAMMTACKKMQVQFTYEKFLHRSLSVFRAAAWFRAKRMKYAKSGNPYRERGVFHGKGYQPPGHRGASGERQSVRAGVFSRA